MENSYVKEQRRWKKRQMRLLRPKKPHLKKFQQRALWEWRLAQKPESERKRFVKHALKMKKYAKRGQLRNGKFYCKAGREITQARIDHYEAMCHFMVRKFLPALALWEGAMDYADLINQCKMETFLALLNGFDPNPHLKPRERTKEELDSEIQIMEQSIVFGRLKDYLRRTRWKYHPENLGGQTRSIEFFTGSGESHHSLEFRFGLYDEIRTDSLDFVREQTDRLMEILESRGPEAARSAFLALDSHQREVIEDSLSSKNRRGTGDLDWGEQCDLG